MSFCFYADSRIKYQSSSTRESLTVIDFALRYQLLINTDIVTCTRFFFYCFDFHAILQLHFFLLLRWHLSFLGTVVFYSHPIPICQHAQKWGFFPSLPFCNFAFFYLLFFSFNVLMQTSPYFLIVLCILCDIVFYLFTFTSTFTFTFIFMFTFTFSFTFTFTLVNCLLYITKPIF